MSIAVRTPTNVTDEDDHWEATGWEVNQDTGHLYVTRNGTAVAEYPAGQWTAVWRVTDTEPQDDDGRASGTAGLLDGAVRALRERVTAKDGNSKHFTLPPDGTHRVALLGLPFDVTAFDYHIDGTATLHAKAAR